MEALPLLDETRSCQLSVVSYQESWDGDIEGVRAMPGCDDNHWWRSGRAGAGREAVSAAEAGAAERSAASGGRRDPEGLERRSRRAVQPAPAQPSPGRPHGQATRVPALQHLGAAPSE